MSSFILRKGSAKVLFTICYSVVIVSDISIATFSYLKTGNSGNENLEEFGWLPIVFVTCIVGANTIGVFPVLQLLMGEVFPSDIRSLAIGLTFSAELCISTANILIYPYLIDSFQFHGTFYFYAVIAFITMLWGMFTIPDNRGLSLAKVEANFATDKKMTDDMK
jgi:MFS family permease